MSWVLELLRTALSWLRPFAAGLSAGRKVEIEKQKDDADAIREDLRDRADARSSKDQVRVAEANRERAAIMVERDRRVANPSPTTDDVKRIDQQLDVLEREIEERKRRGR